MAEWTTSGGLILRPRMTMRGLLRYPVTITSGAVSAGAVSAAILCSCAVLDDDHHPSHH